MKGKVRNLFPGGNTPEGFYSYYRYILGQKEASSIICLKGGPGTGKSHFIKGIGDYFNEIGEDIDYFWCSSDPNSLDGVLLRERKIAILDGTSPHVVDPQTPGAVDTILHLGEYWDGAGLKQCKDHILQSNKKIKRWFSYAYNDLKAAAALRASITDTYQEMMLPGELYKEAAGIVNRELSKYPVTLSEGKRNKYFASAITPDGIVNHVPSLVKDYSQMYGISTPVGFRTDIPLKIISENIVHRGFSVEEYYCPMMPEYGLEHLLVPELDLAFVTLNNYHDMDLCECCPDVKTLEMRDFVDWNRIEPYMESISYCENNSDMLIQQAIGSLKMAKAEHDILEGFYVPNMNFEKIEELKREIIGKIVRKVL